MHGQPGWFPSGPGWKGEEGPLREATLRATLDNMLDERGFEMYWEGWRRQDLIRFGKFLDAWQEKPASNPRALLMPIPNAAVAVNPNLKQNPGY